MISRANVYEAIDSERAYQISKWTQEFDDVDWSLSDWIIFMERYIEEAKSNTGYSINVLAAIRKVAGLAVACMEHNGAPYREIIRPRNEE